MWVQSNDAPSLLAGAEYRGILRRIHRLAVSRHRLLTLLLGTANAREVYETSQSAWRMIEVVGSEQ